MSLITRLEQRNRGAFFHLTDGHAVTHDIYGLKATYEFSAMNEAFSDYLAAAITNDPLIADGAMQNEEFMRRLDNDMVWPKSALGISFNRDGQLFSGALWNMRLAHIGFQVLVFYQHL